MSQRGQKEGTPWEGRLRDPGSGSKPRGGEDGTTMEEVSWIDGLSRRMVKIRFVPYVGDEQANVSPTAAARLDNTFSFNTVACMTQIKPVAKLKTDD